MEEKKKTEFEKDWESIQKEIEEIVTQLNKTKDKVVEEMEVKIEELRKRKDAILKKAENYKTSEQWQQATGHLRSAMEELKNAFQAMVGKKY